MYKEIEGDLIELAKQGKFDVIAHGVNCFCTMGAGIAPQMAKAFGCDQFPLEAKQFRGDLNKLGQIDHQTIYINEFTDLEWEFIVVNAYTQYDFGTKNGIPLDYEALTLCLRKINRLFKNTRVGLPLIGCGLAGGDFAIVKNIIQNELKDCDVTVVIFNK